MPAEGSLVDKHEIYGPLTQVGRAELQEGAAIVKQLIVHVRQQGLPAFSLRLADHQIDIAGLAPVASRIDGMAPYQQAFKTLFAGRLGNQIQDLHGGQRVVYPCLTDCSKETARAGLRGGDSE